MGICVMCAHMPVGHILVMCLNARIVEQEESLSAREGSHEWSLVDLTIRANVSSKKWKIIKGMVSR